MNELKEYLDTADTQNAGLKQRLEAVCIELAKYKRVVDSSLEIDNKDALIPIPQKVNLSYLFSTSCGSKICEFLDVKEILQLREINKFYALAIKNRGEYGLVMAKLERKKWLVSKTIYMRDVGKTISCLINELKYAN